MIDFYTVKDFLWAKRGLVVFLFVIVFVLIHLPAIHFPYHQDEYKWAEYVNPELNVPGRIPHPPVGEFVYSSFGLLVGYDNLRIVPLVFGLLNLVLLFILGGIVFEKRTAVWIISMFTISFYSLLASLMVDTDGAIMVFFFLFTAIFYYKWKEFNFIFKSKWLLLTFLVAILGFLTKESFVLAIFAFALDFALEKRIFEDRKKFLKYLLGGVFGVFILVFILFLSSFVFPFKLEWFLLFLPRFFKFIDRGWFQTFIQLAKAVMYLSPLLVIPLVFIDREIIRKTRPFILFIITGLVFYLVLFDFSVGAIDRYLQFLIVPLCIISGAIFSKVFNIAGELKVKVKHVIGIIFLGALVFITQFFDHIVPSLYPKQGWISKATSFEWNFLFPFTGGSGPTGFYVSFLFIAILWICSILLIIFALNKSNIKKEILFCVLILGILYNAVFIEEYLFGKINGSPYGLFMRAKEFIVNNKDISKIVVYNDIGGYDIRRMGLYERRLYATPQFEAEYRNFFKNFSGQVLYIDIPRVQEKSFYSEYFLSCRNMYEKQDGYISLKIFDCYKKQ